MRVRDVTAGGLAGVEVEAAGAYELLIELSVLTGERAAATLDPEPAAALAAARGRASPGLREALARVGDRSGEVWLHLLGLATGTPAPRDAAALLAHLEATDPLEVRRQVLGADVPAWRKYVDRAVILAAAEGDRAAGARLLAEPRYYAGSARDALAVLLPLDPEETSRRLAEALRRWQEESFAAREAAAVRTLAADAAAARELAAAAPPSRLVELVTGGFAYEPEPECPRVLLVPHLAARPWLLLCQHRDTRLICYPARRPGQERRAAAAEGLLRLGRALGDERRVGILAALAAGPRDLDELAAAVGLARSTVHHHLGLLRAAGLVGLRGNARRYRYALRRDAAAEAATLLADLTNTPATAEEEP
ncbi:MAG TPA: ArsR family transcriptional regulator [Actinomycetes bacterium]|nr:ArsR family transcriptional regulator [Actinomycetes bacterium]